MNLLRFFVLTLGFLLPFNALAMEYVDPYVVTGSHFELPLNQVGSSVTIITAEDIRNQQISSLTDAMKLVPGVDVVQYANGVASVFARGAKSSTMLVMMDGVPINDTTSASFDFSRVSLLNVERVEVVLGAQSAIYGANALSGVVNIISKQGQGEANGSIYAEAGYPTSAKLELQANAGSETLAWAIGMLGRYSNQISSQVERNGYTEKDALTDGALSASLNYTPSDIFELKASFRYDVQELEYDTLIPEDVYDTKIISNRLLLNLAPSLFFLDGKWKQTLNLSYVQDDRETYDDFYEDYWSGTAVSNDNKYRSQIYRADWNNTIDLDWQNIAFGILAEEEKMLNNTKNMYATDKDYSRSNVAVYAEYSMNPIENLFITAAWRMDNYQNYDPEHSGSLSLAYTLAPTQTFFHTSVGKGFKAPTLDELYGVYGNSELKPEYSYTWDIGLRQPLFDNKLELFATYYMSRYENFGVWNSLLWQTEQIGKANSQGVELGFNLRPTKDLTMVFSGTFADTEDESTNSELLRQPNTKLRFDIDYRLPFETSVDYYVGASVNYIGKRYDYSATDANYEAPAYTLVDLRFRAVINEDLSLMLKLGNIFDERYEAIYGYESLGFNGTLGVEYRF